jgi:SAM-dependent methyltransferase
VSKAIHHTNPYQQATFDNAAASYDEEFSFSHTGMLQRKRVHYFLQKKVAALAGKKVLELNCGTGLDAIWLATNGCKVTATDASANMIAVLEDKLTQQPELCVKAMPCGFDETGQKLAGRTFDFVLSNFGGINCADSKTLKQLSAQLHSITNPGAAIALVVMPKKCWWENMYFRLKGNRKERNRRQQPGPLHVNIHGNNQLVWYYEPADIEQNFSATWTIVYTRPIGFFLPPSYMEAYFKKKKILLTLLYGLEKVFGHFAFLSNYADHFLIVLKRKA